MEGIRTDKSQSIHASTKTACKVLHGFLCLIIVRDDLVIPYFFLTELKTIKFLKEPVGHFFLFICWSNWHKKKKSALTGISRGKSCLKEPPPLSPFCSDQAYEAVQICTANANMPTTQPFFDIL